MIEAWASPKAATATKKQTVNDFILKFDDNAGMMVIVFVVIDVDDEARASEWLLSALIASLTTRSQNNEWVKYQNIHRIFCCQVRD